MPGAQVKVIDKGWNAIVKEGAKYLKGRAAAVGFQGVEGEQVREDGITNAGLGGVHEFGTSDGRVPERSYMRSTFDEKQNEYVEEFKQLMMRLTEGADVEGELMLIGEKYRADMINKIRSGLQPPLTEGTIARKEGEATPLYDTGQLINSLTSVVVDPNEKRSVQ